jgi:pimeloyl-ACP methyl ester carboxylesterase/membrane protein DedA with SNARE-associated domain
VFKALSRVVRSLLRRRWVQAYLVLLLLSHLVIAIFAPDFWVGYDREPTTDREMVDIPAMRDDGPVDGRTTTIGVWRWEGDGTGDVPIILLHGSPSQGARDWRNFGPELAARGFETLAIDRIGFGASSKWAPSYSIKANARATLATMDAMEIERAHVVGWSQGGGIAAWMADLAPERVASLTLLGSIGIQEGEGSGSYAFEHFKYGLGYIFIVALPELLPHFNVIGDRAVRHAFIRDFWDTDQRPLRGLMQRLQTPTLVLHGRDDPLIAAWVAEEHHELIEPSRLVMLDASHFFPLGNSMDDEAAFTDAADVIAGFALRHDQPGVVVRRGAVDFAPTREVDDTQIGAVHWTKETPWWAVVLLIIVATFISEDLTVIAVGMLIASGKLDVGVGLVGCFLGIVIGDYGLWATGRFAGRRVLRWPLFRRVLPESSLDKWGRIFDAHVIKSVFLSRMLPGTRLPMFLAAGVLGRRSHHFLFWVTVAVLCWTPLLLLAAALIGPKLYNFFSEIFHGPWAIVAAFIVLVTIIRIVSYEATSMGRQRLKADLKRLVAPEFWPSWLFYVPLVPWVGLLAVRFRGPMTFSCANPGIDSGGGVVGESKTAISEGFADDARMLPFIMIEAGQDPAERARHAIDRLREDISLGGYPAILKPDVAQRGHGVKLVRRDEDVHAYFDSMTRDAQLQAYHPGPHEVGIMWARRVTGDTRMDEAPGEIFSITRKVFPLLEGDGVHTLEELIWMHPRYRMQAKVFLRRFDAESDRVPEKGEQIRLAIAGNHCQGTMFLDGVDLITPELTQRIDAIAQSFRHPTTGARIDYGRFDVRYESDDALKRGEGFAIVELNGTMSESTNIYDPGKPIWWTYGVLFRQWARLFRIGRARRREGIRPLQVRSLYTLVRGHYAGRPGSAVSD